MTDQSWWHVRQGAFTAGPIDQVEVDQLIAWGRLRAGARVWRSGMPGWAPIAAHFALPDGEPESAAPVQPAQPPRRRTFRWPHALALAVSSAAVWAGVAGMLFLFLSASLLEAPPLTAALMWAAAGVATTAALVVSVALWLRLWSRLAGRFSELGGVLSIGAVILSLPVAFFAALQLMQTDFIRRQAAEVSGYTYEITAEPETRTVNVYGTVGPGFARELAKVLRTVGRPATVVVNSSGGLTNEALEAARALGRDQGVTVIAHEQCDSACILLLMGGEKRYADKGMTLGFHAGSPIVEGGLTHLLEEGELDAEANAFMIARGIPKTYLERAAAAGADKLVDVPAGELVKAGVLTGEVVHEEDEPAPPAPGR